MTSVSRSPYNIYYQAARRTKPTYGSPKVIAAMKTGYLLITENVFGLIMLNFSLATISPFPLDRLNAESIFWGLLVSSACLWVNYLTMTTLDFRKDFKCKPTILGITMLLLTSLMLTCCIEINFRLGAMFIFAGLALDLVASGRLADRNSAIGAQIRVISERKSMAYDVASAQGKVSSGFA